MRKIPNICKVKGVSQSLMLYIVQTYSFDIFHSCWKKLVQVLMSCGEDVVVSPDELQNSTRGQQLSLCVAEVV